MTNPTGLNTSPLLKLYPGLENLTSLTSNKVDPIPVDPLTFKSTTNYDRPS